MKSHESTYALLIRSEEKKRGILEVVIYALFILSAIFSIGQFALQPMTEPAASPTPSPCLACTAPISSPPAQG